MANPATDPSGNGAPEWWLGRTSPKKVVHRSTCYHARSRYEWAQVYLSPESLARALVDANADRWHRACQVCCGDLDDAIRAIRIERRVANPMVVHPGREPEGGPK